MRLYELVIHIWLLVALSVAPALATRNRLDRFLGSGAVEARTVETPIPDASLLLAGSQLINASKEPFGAVRWVPQLSEEAERRNLSSLLLTRSGGRDHNDPGAMAVNFGDIVTISNPDAATREKLHLDQQENETTMRAALHLRGGRWILWAVGTVLCLSLLGCVYNCYEQRRYDLAEAEGHIAGPEVDAAQQAMSREEMAALRPASGETGAQSSEPDALELKKKKLTKEKVQILFEHARSKHKLEQLLLSIGEVEAELYRRDAPSKEELSKRAAEMLKSTELTTQKHILGAMAYTMPLLMQSHRISQTFRSRMEKTREDAMKLAFDSTKGLCDDMQRVFVPVDGEVEEIWGKFTSMSLPSLASVLANVLAPLRLQLSYLWNRIQLYQHLTFLLISSVVLFVDNHGCRNSNLLTQMGMVTPAELYTWFIIDATMTTYCFAVLMYAHMTYSGLVKKLERRPELPRVESLIQGFQVVLDYYLTYGAEVHVALVKIQSSFFFHLVTWGQLFSFVWLVYGVEIILNMAYVEITCRPVGLIVLRIRVGLFIVLIIPTLLKLVTFLVQRIMSTHRFQVLVMSMCYRADSTLDLGMPVASLLGQALLVYDREDMLDLQIRMHNLEKEQLASEEKELRAKLEEAVKSKEKEVEKIAKLREALEKERSQSKDERERKHFEEREQILTNAAKVFNRVNESGEKSTEQLKKEVAELEEALKNQIGWEETSQYLQMKRQQLAEACANSPELLRGLKESEDFKRAVAAGQAAFHDLQENEHVRKAAERAQQVVHDIQDNETVKAATAKAKQVAHDIQESEAVQKATEKARQVAHDIQESEAVQAATEKAKQVVRDVQENEHVQAAAAHAKQVVHDIQENETVQEATAQAKQVAHDIQENEHVQAATAHVKQTVHDIEESEAVQSAKAKAKQWGDDFQAKESKEPSPKASSDEPASSSTSRP
mmetsp:Transcript_9908/g.21775  ORF Transcript_9908/g.21775 Transcript_9908/m.21775 type:complete len:947 (+) Transcript_9908:98-2938(+)